MMKITLATLALAAATPNGPTRCDAFVPPATSNAATYSYSSSMSSMSSMSRRLPRRLYSSSEGGESDSAFVAIADDEDKTFDAVEKFGKGAAKAKRGKRKGGEAASSASSSKAFATLAPEETFYEGPPAITETIAPTISILTVVGIVPAAAAWARQAWVRYTITDRRIRVTSGIGGKDMAEIVYPDVVEIRTVKRLFGDGDMVFFLRDGAKFEMRNVPNFDETIEFILKNVDEDVVRMYKAKGDVGAQ
ncbi:hypothetical protein ACHAW5_001934 [Stephanodiscus triporus]|uniref:YdbS-like PH domain-containing protein n=1 Tax=Stephanodiscus triporus TaxID=2934178 RepID=A0ABD3MIM7_9STRA